jgi:hypothetical protein
MDPYLERDWLDVHSALVTYIRDQIQDQLPADLCARMESRVLVDDDKEKERAERHPDVRVFGAGRGGGAAVLERPVLAEAEPDLWVTEMRREPEQQRRVEIVDAQTRSRVITVIELVSPSNKLPGIGQKLYEKKRDECLFGNVNLVEIDLTRRGDRLSLFPYLAEVYPLPTYVACVHRATDNGRTAVYLLPLDKPLKPIRIPLRSTDEDIILNLQPLVVQAYERGRYDRLDYSAPLDPPPSREEAAVIERVLRDSGKLLQLPTPEHS